MTDSNDRTLRKMKKKLLEMQQQIVELSDELRATQEESSSRALFVPDQTPPNTLFSVDGSMNVAINSQESLLGSMNVVFGAGAEILPDGNGDGTSNNVVVGAGASSGVDNSIVLGKNAQTFDCNSGQFVLSSCDAPLQLSKATPPCPSGPEIQLPHFLCPASTGLLNDSEIPLGGGLKSGYQQIVSNLSAPVYYPSPEEVAAATGCGVPLCIANTARTNFYQGLRVAVNGLHYLTTVVPTGPNMGQTKTYCTYIPIVLHECPPPIQVHQVKFYMQEALCNYVSDHITGGASGSQFGYCDNDCNPLFGQGPGVVNGATGTIFDHDLFTISPTSSPGHPTNCYAPGQMVTVTFDNKDIGPFGKSYGVVPTVTLLLDDVLGSPSFATGGDGSILNKHSGTEANGTGTLHPFTLQNPEELVCYFADATGLAAQEVPTDIGNRYFTQGTGCFKELADCGDGNGIQIDGKWAYKFVIGDEVCQPKFLIKLELARKLCWKKCLLDACEDLLADDAVDIDDWEENIVVVGDEGIAANKVKHAGLNQGFYTLDSELALCGVRMSEFGTMLLDSDYIESYRFDPTFDCGTSTGAFILTIQEGCSGDDRSLPFANCWKCPPNSTDENDPSFRECNPEGGFDLCTTMCRAPQVRVTIINNSTKTDLRFKFTDFVLGNLEGLGDVTSAPLGTGDSEVFCFSVAPNAIQNFESSLQAVINGGIDITPTFVGGGNVVITIDNKNGDVAPATQTLPPLGSGTGPIDPSTMSQYNKQANKCDSEYCFTVTDFP